MNEIYWVDMVIECSIFVIGFWWKCTCSGYRSCKTWWRGVPRASGPACVPGTNLVVLVDFEAWVLCQMVDIGQCLYIYFVLLDSYHLCLYFVINALLIFCPVWFDVLWCIGFPLYQLCSFCSFCSIIWGRGHVNLVPPVNTTILGREKNLLPLCH